MSRKIQPTGSEFIFTTLALSAVIWVLIIALVRIITH